MAAETKRIRTHHIADGVSMWRLILTMLTTVVALTAAELEVLQRAEAVPVRAASWRESRGHLGSDRSHLFRQKRAVAMERRQLFADTKTYKELDIIFALERSNLPMNSKRNFMIEQKTFVRSIIRDFLHIRPDATNVALLTYGTDVTIIFNGFPQGQNIISKCDLIGTDYLWDQIIFNDGPTSRGANLTAAFAVAEEIMKQGRERRNAARSYLVLITSAPADFQRTPVDWFDTFGVGVSDEVDMRKLSNIVANSNSNIYGSIREWRETMRIVMELSHVIEGAVPEWVPYDGPGCSCPSRTPCWCDINTGFTRCSCAEGYLDNQHACVKPCARDVCPKDEFDCQTTFGGINYACLCNSGSMGCDELRVVDCPTNACGVGGTCFEGRNQYACVCHQGYTGRHCEVVEDACRTPNICPHYSRCQTLVNSYSCINNSRSVPQTTPGPWAIPTSTPHLPATLSWGTRGPVGTIPRTPASPRRPTTAGPGPDTRVVATEDADFLHSLSDDHRLLLMVVPPAALGLIVLIIGIGSLIYVVRKRKDRRKNDVSGVTDTTSIASHSPSLVTFDSKCYTNEGTPGPPKMSKAMEAESNRVSYGEFDDPLYGNEAMHRGMEEWYPFVLELYSSNKLNRVLIVRLDGEKWVLSPGSKLYMGEVEAVFNLLSKKMIKGTFNIQGREFGIVGNNDFVIMAHTFRNTKREQEILCATKTRQFVIIGSANFATDGGQCKEKVLELRDHIKVQGL